MALSKEQKQKTNYFSKGIEKVFLFYYINYGGFHQEILLS